MIIKTTSVCLHDSFSTVLHIPWHFFFSFCFFSHSFWLLSWSIISSSPLLSLHVFPSLTLSFSSRDEASHPFHHFNHHPWQREKAGDVKDYQDHCFDGYPSFLWVGAFWCFLTSMYVHAFSSVKRMPVSRPATENVRLKNGVMGIDSLLRGLRWFWGVNVDEMSQNSKNRMSFFMHTLYLYREYIDEYIDVKVYKGWVDEWMT